MAGLLSCVGGLLSNDGGGNSGNMVAKSEDRERAIRFWVGGVGAPHRSGTGAKEGGVWPHVGVSVPREAEDRHFPSSSTVCGSVLLVLLLLVVVVVAVVVWKVAGIHEGKRSP